MKIKGLLIFVAGVAAGATGMYFGMKDVFEAQYKRDKDDVQAAYALKIEELRARYEIKEPEKEENHEETEEKEVKSIRTVPLPDGKDIEEYVQRVNYTEYSSKNKDPEKKKTTIPKEFADPYAISPVECGEEVGFEHKSLTYFAQDDIFMNDLTEEVDREAPKYMPSGFVDMFGQYEPDILCVRSERNGTDYEITLIEDETYDEHMCNFELD